MTTTRNLERWTGILILCMAVIAIGGAVSMPDLTRGTPAVAAPLGAFRFALLTEALVFLFEVWISVLIYRIFQRFDPTLALVSALSRLAMAAVQAVNLVFHLAILPAVGDGAMTSLLLNLHQGGVWTWQFFFGLHLLSLGVLAWRTVALPRGLALAIALASLGYWLDSLRGVLGLTAAVWAGLNTGLLIVSTLAELFLAFWLIGRGLAPHALREQAGLAQVPEAGD